MAALHVYGNKRFLKEYVAGVGTTNMFLVFEYVPGKFYRLNKRQIYIYIYIYIYINICKNLKKRGIYKLCKLCKICKIHQKYKYLKHIRIWGF